VTSTYPVNDERMQSGVWDLGGGLLSRATGKDTVVLGEADLPGAIPGRAAWVISGAGSVTGRPT